MNEANLCPDCKDTGVYRGLNTVEPCRTCGGKKGMGLTLFGKPIVEVSGMEAGPDIAFGHARYVSAEAFGVLRDGGQTIRHAVEEQVAEPLEIPFLIHSMSQVNIDVDYRFGKTARRADTNTLEMELIISSFICSLTDIRQEPFRYADCKRVIQGQERFTAVFQCGDDAKRIEDVMMVACHPSENGTTADFILEWDPNDA